MESRVGLDYIVEHAEYAGKLAAALASPTVPVKKQVFELLSALCVYNAEGYARAVDTLERYKSQSGGRYRLSVVVEELRAAAAPDYQTALVAFVNCLVISAPRQPDRVRVRNELIGLGLLPALSQLRHEAASHPDLAVQLDVFAEQRDADEAQALGPGGVNLNSHLDVFYAVMKQVADTPQETVFLSILQHLLRMEPAAAGGAAWAAAETLVHRAAVAESADDATKLLRAPAQSKCTCQHRDLASVGRKQSLQRALSPPPPPPPPVDIQIQPPACPVPPPPPTCPPPPPACPPPPPQCPPPPPQCPPPPPTAPAAPPTPEPVLEVLPQQETPLPKTKMKTINWNKIPSSKVVGQSNIWSLVASSHKDSPKELDWGEIEGLFCQQAQPTGSAGSSPRLGRSPLGDAGAAGAGGDRKRKEATEVQILDGKRSLNVNIFLKQFRSSTEDIIALIVGGAHAAVGAERLRGLLRTLPEPHERELLAASAGERLGPAERFLLRLVQVPDYKLRIECMLLKEEWSATVGALESAVSAVLAAADDLVSCRALQEVLYIALIAGNFLNAGGYAGAAAGVRLHSLLKLADIRSNAPGVSLLHYVAKQAERKNKQLIHFADDTRALEEAARAAVEPLQADLRALELRVRSLRRELRARPAADLHAQMEGFLEAAERETRALQRELGEVEAARRQLAAFFCEDEETFKLEDCFKTFLTFCTKFRAAVADNERRRAAELQAAARRRARDAQAPRLKGASAGSTPISECESLMESLLLDIRNGLGRRSLRRRDATPSPDVTPTGSLRRRRVSPGAGPGPGPGAASPEDDALLELLRAGDQRERNWGSLDRSFSRGAPVRARLELPPRERAPSPLAAPAAAPTAVPAAPAAAPAAAGSPDTPRPEGKPKEWRAKIESWLRANSAEERRAAELRARARELQAHRRSLEHDSESERSTLGPLPEARAEWRPAVPSDSALVRAIEAVEDVQPAPAERGPRRAEDGGERRRRALRAGCETDGPGPGPAADKVEIDSDNIETPPAQRRFFTPPPEREPCRRLQAARLAPDAARARADMRDLCQEILGDGQFDRFSAARRTRRYKKPADPGAQDDDAPPPPPDAPPRPTTLPVQGAYPAGAADATEEKERWQDRLPEPPAAAPSPAKDKEPFAKMRRQTSINQEDVQKAIRELKSPTEPPTGVWPRSALRRSVPARPAGPAARPARAAPARAAAAAAAAAPAPRTKAKAEPELNDEGFEETQSLNSESASQGASSGCLADCGSPPPPAPAGRRPPRAAPAPRAAPPRAAARAAPPRGVERSASRASLRSSRSSLNSAASVATVRRAPQARPPPPAARAVWTPAPRAARTPASRSSSSGSSVGAGRAARRPPTSGFMRPTQASRGRGAPAVK